MHALGGIFVSLPNVFPSPFSLLSSVNNNTYIITTGKYCTTNYPPGGGQLKKASEILQFFLQIIPTEIGFFFLSRPRQLQGVCLREN